VRSSARALLDNATLRKRLEEHAQLQMNSVSATAGSLLAGIGCAIGTPFFMKEHLDAETLVARQIVSPELKRTLYMCEMSDRPATFALETIRQLCINLTLDAISSGQWEAQVALP